MGHKTISKQTTKHVLVWTGFSLYVAGGHKRSTLKKKYNDTLEWQILSVFDL